MKLQAPYELRCIARADETILLKLILAKWLRNDFATKYTAKNQLATPLMRLIVPSILTNSFD